MKKFLLLFAAILTITSFAQNFEVELNAETLHLNANDEGVFRFELINTGAQEISLYIVRTENNIPNDWSSSLCFSYCFSPTVDSIATTRDFGSNPIAPGDTAEVSLHVFTAATPDSGFISIKIGSLDDAANYETFNLSAYAMINDVDENINAYEFSLAQNYPNPFNPTTTIWYSIPNASVTTGKQSVVNVSLTVYNSLGQKVATLVNKMQTAGKYSVQFDASGLPSGIYFYKLQAANSVLTKKMILMK